MHENSVILNKFIHWSCLYTALLIKAWVLKFTLLYRWEAQVEQGKGARDLQQKTTWLPI